MLDRISWKVVYVVREQSRSYKQEQAWQNNCAKQQKRDRLLIPIFIEDCWYWVIWQEQC